MQVLLVNGSPHQHGCTYTALAEIAHTLQEEGIDSEIFWIGNKPIGGCIGCHGCVKLGKCAFDDDPVNAFTAKAKAADGFIFGSPVHYAAATGNMTAFMDRVFYSDGCGKGRVFYLKHAAAVASARRAGTTATLVLEYGSRLYPGGCDERPGGSASDAGTGAEYGLLLKM